MKKCKRNKKTRKHVKKDIRESEREKKKKNKWVFDWVKIWVKWDAVNKWWFDHNQSEHIFLTDSLSMMIALCFLIISMLLNLIDISKFDVLVKSDDMCLH